MGVISVLLSSWLPGYAQHPAVQDSFTTLQAHFANPPVNYSTAPLWVWNDAVTRARIDEQLTQFRQEHILQVFIHPRPGLITEYLSDEWFALCRYAVEKGEDIGMNIWLYDENSFPSGFGGGHVPAQMPASYRQGMAMRLQRGHEIQVDRLDQYLVVLRREGSQFVPTKTLPPDEKLDDYYAVEIAHEEASGWYGGFTYVDLLIPEVTEKFIAETMRGYERAVGAKFGQHVPGIFTDEPNITPPGGKQSLRWTPALFERFAQRWGYDLRPHLPALIEEAGAFRRVRYHYYQLLLELFIDGWSKPWYRYTEDKGLTWTGHYWEHGWPNPQHGSDHMAMYAWHQMPGIDMLFNAPQQRPDQFGNVRAVKELSSVANQLGKHRTLSETYGAAGWDLSFADMKRLGDWQYALGVNFMSQHLSYMTLKGRRKGDFPQSFLTHAPYWAEYGALARYFHRLSWTLSRGEQHNATLLIEPTTTAWMYYSPADNHPKLDTIEASFRALVDTLEGRQWEYDLGSENIIKDHGRIVGNRWIVGERTYRTVVLPPYTENLDSTTFRLLAHYVRAGGQVVALTVPRYVNGLPTSAVEDLLAAHPDRCHLVETVTDPSVVPLLADNHFRVVANPASPLHHQRRQLADGQLVFWANFDEQTTASVSFSLPGQAVSCLDPLSGEVQPYPFIRTSDSVTVQATLPAAGSLLLFVHQRAAFNPPDPPRTQPKSIPVEGTTRVTATSPNILALDYLNLEVNGRTWSDLYFTAAADSAYRLNGLLPYGRLGHNPWAAAVQYKTNVLDMGQRFNAQSGFRATYHFELEQGFTPDSLRAMIEWPQLYRVTLNGQAISPLPGRTWLDHAYGVFDIGHWVRPGRNTLTLTAAPMHIHAELESVFLVGDFRLKAAERGFVMAPPTELTVGAWSEQGMPFYFDGVRYAKTITPQEGRTYRIQLNQWNGTVARVIVNGQKAGIIGWPPYSLDITAHLQEGNNEVAVEVVGSLRNLFGPHHREELTPGVVTPWSWYFVPSGQPPGLAYQVLPYGLLEDFTILSETP